MGCTKLVWHGLHQHPKSSFFALGISPFLVALFQTTRGTSLQMNQNKKQQRQLLHGHHQNKKEGVLECFFIFPKLLGTSASLLVTSALLVRFGETVGGVVICKDHTDFLLRLLCLARIACAVPRPRWKEVGFNI